MNTTINTGWTPELQPASRAQIEELIKHISALAYSPERENARLALQNAVECCVELTEKLEFAESPTLPEQVDCPACEGTGNCAVHGLEPSLCSYCNGTGKVAGQADLDGSDTSMSGQLQEAGFGEGGVL